jgi:Flp pilus assembly pilin Flp
MRGKIRQFLNDRGGATSIEYALVAAMLSIAAIVGFSSMANSVVAMFDNTDTAVSEAWQAP